MKRPWCVRLGSNMYPQLYYNKHWHLILCLCLIVRIVRQSNFLWFCHILFDGLRKEESIFCLVLPLATLIKCHFLPAVLIPIAPPSMPSSSSFCNGNFCAPYFVQFTREREKISEEKMMIHVEQNSDHWDSRRSRESHYMFFLVPLLVTEYQLWVYWSKKLLGKSEDFWISRSKTAVGRSFWGKVRTFV